jgi:FkbH-like protein
MDIRLMDLPWLVPPPTDFRQKVRRLAREFPDAETSARQLAAYKLSANQLHILGIALSNLTTLRGKTTRLGVLSNGTTDLLLPALTASALRHGVWLQVIGTDFDQVALEALNPDSELHRAQCDFVLLCLDDRGLSLEPIPGDARRAQRNVDASLQYIDSIRHALHGSSRCTVIVQTLPQVTDSLFGSLERDVPGTRQWLIDKFNRKIRFRIRSSGDLLLDTAALAEMVGVSRWHDPVQWTLGKFQFSHEVLPLYSDWVGRLIASARGQSRKCLVLDLDNTLWGGVIGDDGLAGIVLGNGDPAGEAYLKIQRAALALRERGIILAVSSKNDDHVARAAFRSCPEMLLKEEHIAVFQANWMDKASNLEAIARSLNIGIDALVLLDDNPAERAQVRAALPAVAVPELPEDPAFYADMLLAAGYFEACRFTAEDRTRADQYRVNIARTAALSESSNLESHLRSLQMRAACRPFDAVNRPRITQLINKTNQFNLTTRRYTESEVEAFEKYAAFTLQVRLIDRYGDNGVIAVAICAERDSDWIIDTWLMSCRVLNRKVEHAMLNCIVSSAKSARVKLLLGQYIKTERNGLVREHYARLGFSPCTVSELESQWQLSTETYIPVDVPIQIDASLRMHNDGQQRSSEFASFQSGPSRKQ